MKTESFYAKRIHPIVMMALITIVCILVTATLHLGTLERVQTNEQFFLWRSILDAAGIPHDGDPASVAALYQEGVTEEEGIYHVTGPDGSVRYVKQYTGPGLWGPITVMVGFTEDTTTLSGVSIVSQNETPGLGARIEEAWFTAQFADRQGPFTMVEEGTSDAPNEIDAITGATRTSEAFRNIINRAVADSDTIARGQ